MKANWICWISCICSRLHTHLHVHVSSCTHTTQTAVNVQKQLNFHLPSLKSDTCKNTNLNPVFTLIFIWLNAYLFLGDEWVSSCFKFLWRTLTFSVFLPERCLPTLLKFIWNTKNKHWGYLHLTMIYSQSQNRCYIYFFEFLVQAFSGFSILNYILG